MKERINGVYYLLNTQNHRIYIGQSGDVQERLSQHVRSLRNGQHGNKALQADWNTYGEATFTFDLLTTHPETHAVRGRLSIEQIERIFIHAYQADNPIYGYNCNHSEKSINSRNRFVQLDIEANDAARKYRTKS